MNQRTRLWAPAAVMMGGILLTLGVHGQRAMQLRAPLSRTIPREIAGQIGKDIHVSRAEQEVAGMSSYVLRAYSPSGDLQDQTSARFSIYVGYYAAQLRGRTIHSPKNCLPGAGWEALKAAPAVITTATGAITVNRYLLQRGSQKALVLYWYQGRGRVQANEYRVKWDLLRDAALKHRTEEALVRIVVPATDEASAFREASRVASLLVGAVDQSLPRLAI